MEETLGKRIAKNRKRMGLTQDRLAELLGVTAQAVSKWENDQSCPDIQTLPKLASIFGITTDELLGAPRTVEAEVDQEEDPDSTVEITVPTQKKASIGLAVWLLIAGCAALYFSLMKKDIPLFTVFWSSGLLTFGLFGLYPRFSPFRLGCALAGGYFLAGIILNLPGLGWPVVLIVLGILLLIRGLQKQKEHTFRCGTHPHVKVKGVASGFQMKGDHFSCESSFCDKNNLVTLDTLRYGYVSGNFGHMTVDLRGCREIMDGAEVELQYSFGEVNLLVPASCRVILQVDNAFGEVKVIGQPAENAAATLRVTGDVHFGQGSVQYF